MIDSELNHKSYQKKEEEEKTKEILDSELSVEEPVEDEIVEEVTDFFGLTKEEQVQMLLELGLSKSEIRKLRTEKNRVKKLIELTE